MSTYMNIMKQEIILDEFKWEWLASLPLEFKPSQMQEGDPPPPGKSVVAVYGDPIEIEQNRFLLKFKGVRISE